MSIHTLFNENLSSPGYIELEYDLPRLVKRAENAKEVADDYADDYQFGFYEDDFDNASNHLLKSLWGLVAYADDDDAAVRVQDAGFVQQLAVVLSDFAHYLDAMTFSLKITDETEGAFLEYCEALVDLGCGAELVAMLESRFEIPSEPLVEGDQFVDLWSVCVHLGDYYLHEKCDIELAMKLYEVAGMDWQGFRTYKGFHEVGYSYARELEKWDGELTTLRRIFAYRSVSVEKAADDLREVLEAYEAFRRCQHDNPAEQLAIAGRLVAQLKAHYGSSDDRDNKLHSTPFARVIALCAMVLRHQSVLPALSVLADLPKSEEGEEIGLIASYCLSNKIPGENPVVGYIRDASPTNSGSYEFLLEIPRVENAVAEIKRQLIAADINEVSYYTTLDTFKYMLPSSASSKGGIGRLSIMNVAYMNDPTEGKMLANYLEEEAPGVRVDQRDSAKYPYVFMKCFTPQIDDIPMWSMYGDDGKGVCVILDWRKTVHSSRSSAKVGVDLELYRVCYLNMTSPTPVQKKDNEHLSAEQRSALGRSLQELKDAYRKAQTTEQKELVESFLEEVNHLFKSRDYSHEKELRLVHYGKGGIRKTAGNPPLLYVQSPFPVHVKELVLGPKFEQVSRYVPYLQNEVEEMCDFVGAAYPRITLSAVRYV